MNCSIRRRRRWVPSKLDKFEDLITAETKRGASLGEIRDLLANQGVKVHKSTVSRFLRNLPSQIVR